jgi:hypothetical protein
MVRGGQFRREESVDKCELTQPRLFCFGLGYTGLRVARAAQARGWRVAGTCRDASKAIALRREGIATFLFDGRSPLSDAAEALAGTTHLLCAVPPDAESDPVLRLHSKDIAALSATLTWLGLLSSTGIYGDCCATRAIGRGCTPSLAQRREQPPAIQACAPAAETRKKAGAKAAMPQRSTWLTARAH